MKYLCLQRQAGKAACTPLYIHTHIHVYIYIYINIHPIYTHQQPPPHCAPLSVPQTDPCLPSLDPGPSPKSSEPEKFRQVQW